MPRAYNTCLEGERHDNITRDPTGASAWANSSPVDAIATVACHVCPMCVCVREGGWERERARERERDRGRKARGREGKWEAGLWASCALFCIEESARQPEIASRCPTCRQRGARPSAARGGEGAQVAHQKRIEGANTGETGVA